MPSLLIEKRQELLASVMRDSGSVLDWHSLNLNGRAIICGADRVEEKPQILQHIRLEDID